MTDTARRPRAADVAVAAGCWVIACGLLLASPVLAESDDASSVVVAPPGSLGWWSTLATVTVQAVALVWIRPYPRAALVTVAAVPLLLSVTGSADTFSLTAVAIVVAVFFAALRVSWRRARSSLMTAAVALITAGFVNGALDGRLGAGPDLVAAAVQAVGAIGGPLLVAGAIAGRREARDAERRELQAVARAHDALVQTAVAQERTAMARELHDIAAHHLSGIALMAAAVDRQIDTDPETAKRSVGQIRTQSTAVLDDLRRLVGLMREDAEAPRSVATLASLAELVDQERAGGRVVELQTLPAATGRVLGEGIGTLAQLGAYRMVQESLTNAARHAPGAPTTVEIDDRQAEALVLSVVNGPGPPGRPSAGGFGLVGMQERADLLGAALRYGPTPDGGWQVRVEIPRDLTGRGSSLPGPSTEGTSAEGTSAEGTSMEGAR